MLIFVLVFVVCIVFELAWLRFNGTPVPRPDIPRGVQLIGKGAPLTFVVLGDSTSVSQGSTYQQGYAVAAAQHLAQTYAVTWANVGVSGARAQDVATKQADDAAALRPDIAVIAIGANDVTHLTDFGNAQQSLLQAIDILREANPGVRIILTGSPDMGSPRRLPQPLRWAAGERTKSFNDMVVRLVQKEKLTFAPIAAKTGPTFRKHPELFAPDNFHPNGQGYALWSPVIITAIDEALNQ